MELLGCVLRQVAEALCARFLEGLPLGLASMWRVPGALLQAPTCVPGCGVWQLRVLGAAVIPFDRGRPGGVPPGGRAGAPHSGLCRVRGGCLAPRAPPRLSRAAPLEVTSGRQMRKSQPAAPYSPQHESRALPRLAAHPGPLGISRGWEVWGAVPLWVAGSMGESRAAGGGTGALGEQLLGLELRRRACHWVHPMLSTFVLRPVMPRIPGSSQSRGRPGVVLCGNC